MSWKRHLVILSSCHLLAVIVLLTLTPAQTQAHPVPREFYDRTIIVRLTSEGVVVEYSLQLDDWTIFRDVAALDREELGRVSSPKQVYELFTRKYGPILADNLIAKLDGKELAFRCVKHSHQVVDHVRCDFLFRADWPSRGDKPHGSLNRPQGSLNGPHGSPRILTFRDGNYLVERGRIDLSLGSDFIVIDRVVPDAELKERAELDLRPGDADKLRSLRVTFESRLAVELGPMPRREGEPASEVSFERLHPPREEVEEAQSTRKPQLHELLFRREEGLIFLLALAAFLGAAHALTPGHGKTMVAAYLVGQHGTVWHALLLGIVTTLTHTGAVLALAGLFLLIPSEALTRDVQVLLGFISGILVTGLGFWLLMRRLQRQPDHFHIGGHDHHHDHADHFHDEQGEAHPVPAGYPGVWGLVVLGISGGIVPCWDAIALFVRGVFLGQPWLTLALLLAFSAGLAAVLVLIGVLVVTVKGFAGSKFGEGRLSRLLSLVSAVFIMLMGVWLSYDSLHPHPEDSPPGVTGRP